MLAERQILDKLYEVANDEESEKLDELRERAGMVWRCKKVKPFTPDHRPPVVCGWVNKPEDTHCEDCGATRPDR